MKLDKVTERAGSATKRWYDDACGTAHGLELIGERWALLVVRELMFGAKRFGALRASLPGISANVLTQRLEGLETAGIVLRRKLPPPASAWVYELTQWGYEAEPVIQVLGRWAARSPGHDPQLPLSAASLMLSFRTMLSTERAAGIDVRIGFVMGEDRFAGHLTGADFEVARGSSEGADTVFTGAPEVIAGAVYGGVSLAALEADGALVVSGDRTLAERFVTLFVLPAKAA